MLAWPMLKVKKSHFKAESHIWYTYNYLWGSLSHEWLTAKWNERLLVRITRVMNECFFQLLEWHSLRSTAYAKEKCPRFSFSCTGLASLNWPFPWSLRCFINFWALKTKQKSIFRAELWTQHCKTVKNNALIFIKEGKEGKTEFQSIKWKQLTTCTNRAFWTQIGSTQIRGKLEWWRQLIQTYAGLAA